MAEEVQDWVWIGTRMRRVHRCNPKDTWLEHSNTDIKKVVFFYSTFYGVGNSGIFHITFLLLFSLMSTFFSSFSCFALAFSYWQICDHLFVSVVCMSGPFRSFFHPILLFHPAHKPKNHARSRYFCVGLSQSQVTQQPLVSVRDFISDLLDMLAPLFSAPQLRSLGLRP